MIKWPQVWIQKKTSRKTNKQNVFLFSSLFSIPQLAPFLPPQHHSLSNTHQLHSKHTDKEIENLNCPINNAFIIRLPNSLESCHNKGTYLQKQREWRGILIHGKNVLKKQSALNFASDLNKGQPACGKLPKYNWY